MVKCNKRQREMVSGIMQYRCIHPQSQYQGQIVTDATCSTCSLIKKSIKPCKEVRKETKLPVLNLQPGYPECPYRYSDVATGTQKCSITNLGVDTEVCGRCDKETRKRSATFGNKVVNYFGAIRRWVASGRPKRTQEEVERLFETHCKRCERYDSNKHACKNCGCKVSTASEPLGNKLAMATEHCPLGRF